MFCVKCIELDKIILPTVLFATNYTGLNGALEREIFKEKTPTDFFTKKLANANSTGNKPLRDSETLNSSLFDFKIESQPVIRWKKQCDQMARLFVDIWLLTTAQICPKFI